MGVSVGLLMGTLRRAHVPTPGFPACVHSHTAEPLAPPQVHQVGLHLRLGDVQGGSLGCSCLISCALLSRKEEKQVCLNLTWIEEFAASPPAPFSVGGGEMKCVVR